MASAMAPPRLPSSPSVSAFVPAAAAPCTAAFFLASQLPLLPRPRVRRRLPPRPLLRRRGEVAEPPQAGQVGRRRRRHGGDRKPELNPVGARGRRFGDEHTWSRGPGLALLIQRASQADVDGGARPDHGGGETAGARRPRFRPPRRVAVTGTGPPRRPAIGSCARSPTGQRAPGFAQPTRVISRSRWVQTNR